MEQLEFQVNNVSIFVRIILERKLEEFKNKTYRLHKVPNITWTIWAELQEVIEQDNYDSFLDALYDIQYEGRYDMTKDDVKILRKLFDIKRQEEKSYIKLQQAGIHLQKQSEWQECVEKKPQSIVRALNNTYWDLYQDDKAIYDLLQEYFSDEKEVTLNADNLEKVAQYAIDKMFQSITFAENYLKTWHQNDFIAISKTANQLLHKYRETEVYDKLCDLLKRMSRSYVYSAYHKQFKFLDTAFVRHTDSVLEFVADYIGECHWTNISIDDYPKCDSFIAQYIEIKGAYDKEESLGRFK